MMNIPLVLKLQEEHDIELTRADHTSETVVAVTSKELSPTVKHLLQEAVQQPVQFVVGIKLATREKIDALLRRIEPGTRYRLHQKDNTVVVDTDLDASEVWSDICEAMIKDGFPRKWKFGDLVFDKMIVEEAGLRPRRDRPIGSDDLLNLQIALGTAKSLDDFLSML